MERGDRVMRGHKRQRVCVEEKDEGHHLGASRDKLVERSAGEESEKEREERARRVEVRV